MLRSWAISLSERTEQYAALAIPIPIGRLGSAEEIANAIIFVEFATIVLRGWS